MPTDVLATNDPSEVLSRAGRFLASDPVRHNVILTLLHGRVGHPEPGRYWVVRPEEPAGVVFQSPLDFPATVTPMSDDAVVAAVDAIVGAGVLLPGVSGEASTAARFAGHWTERTGSAAGSIVGQRIYEVRDVRPPDGVPGTVRQAGASDRDVVVEWVRGFHVAVGEKGGDVDELVDRRLPAGRFWLWEDRQAVSMAALSEPFADVVRVQAVYTPPEHRRHGYASACVAELSSSALADGHRCILYTDLGNPTSNSIYREIGYGAVSEGLSYSFT